MYLYVEVRSTTWTTIWEDANYNTVWGPGPVLITRVRVAPTETFGKDKTHVYFGLWQKRAARISSDQN